MVEEPVCYKCDPKGISRRVVEVEKKEGLEVYHFECGHTSRRFFVTLVENIILSDSIEISLIINPVPEIEQSLKNQDYFRAVTFLAAVLEYYGKLAIDGKLEGDNRSIDWGRIEGLSFGEVAVFLYALGIIGQPCYSVMIELNKLRNDLLHIRDAADFRRRCGPEAEATTRRAMECFKVLMK